VEAMRFVAKAVSDAEEFVLYAYDGEECSFPFLRVLVPTIVVDFFLQKYGRQMVG